MKYDRHNRRTGFQSDAHVDDAKAHQTFSYSPVKATETLWTFKMVDATDFATPETGLTVTAQISKDGAAFGALDGTPAVTEIGSGWYKVTVSADDMDADVILLKASASGAAQTDEVFYPAS